MGARVLSMLITGLAAAVLAAAILCPTQASGAGIVETILQAAKATPSPGSAPPAKMADIATPIPEQPAEEPPPDPNEERRQELLRRRAKLLFDKGAMAAARGRLALARSHFERIERLPLEGDGAEYVSSAEQAIAAINAKGDEVLAQAQQFRIARRYLEAADYYEELEREFRGTAIGQVAARESKALLADPEIGADILSKRALRYEQAGDLWRAYQQYHELATRYPDTELGKQAAGKAQQLRRRNALPELMSPEIELQARKLLMIARIRTLNRGLDLGLDPASDYYEQVIARFPGTHYAEEAARRLKELEGPP